MTDNPNSQNNQPDNQLEQDATPTQAEVNTTATEGKQAENGEKAVKQKGPHPREVIAQLAEAWPAAFFRNAREVKPLAIGVLKQILANRPESLQGLNSKAIRRGVKFYTNSIAYHRAMLTASHRINLDGSQSDEITEDMREYAQQQLALIPKPERKPRAKKSVEGEGKGRRRRGGERAGRKRAEQRASSRRRPGGKPVSPRAPAVAVKQSALSMEDKLAQLVRHFSGKE